MLLSKVSEKELMIPTEELIKMADFALKNYFFEFNEEVKRLKFETTIATKFTPPYVCIFLDAVEIEFLTSKYLEPFLWFHHIDEIFFIWTHREEKLVQLLNVLNNFHLKFTYETSKNNVNF